MSGYIALHRKILENPIVCKDTDHMAVWVYLLLNATHTEYDSMFKGERVTLTPGQLLTGRKSIATKLKINESKVQRILKLFESEQQIEQLTSNQNRLITIINWKSYQRNGQADEQQVNNERTTSEQRVNTNNNVNKEKNDKNDKKEDIYVPVIEYLNSKANKKYQTSTQKTRSLINARINEGFTLEDFYKVIDNKVSEWKGDKAMDKFLRPETLFGNKFEGYLNEDIKIANKVNKPSQKTRFHNFEQRTDKYTAQELEDVAARKRREYRERMKVN